jgi:hypothetical protein
MVVSVSRQKSFCEKLSDNGIGISLVDVLAALANELSDRRAGKKSSTEALLLIARMCFFSRVTCCR